MSPDLCVHPGGWAAGLAPSAPRGRQEEALTWVLSLTAKNYTFTGCR